MLRRGPGFLPAPVGGDRYRDAIRRVRSPGRGQWPCSGAYYLAGLTCTEETATIKAGAQAHASRHGLMPVMPDTSPRGAGISYYFIQSFMGDHIAHHAAALTDG